MLNYCNVEIGFRDGDDSNLTIEGKNGFVESIEHVNDVVVDLDYDYLVVWAGEHYNESIRLSNISKITMGDYVLTLSKKDV